MPAPHIRTNLRNAQLFLDDSWIEDAGYVNRVWHQANKYPDPVIRADKPWERNCIVAYGSVIQHGGKFKAWYINWTRDFQMMVCYADSDDGIHWEKPNLGLHEFNGSTDNNIVMTPKEPNGMIDDITVIDDRSDRAWPLKALYWDDSTKVTNKKKKSPSGIYLSRSKDGIHWESMGKVLPRFGDRFNVLGSKHGGKYKALVRAPGMRDGGKGRVAHYIESKDLKRWSKPRRSVEADVEDAAHMEIYSMVPFQYEGLVLGGIERMVMSPDILDTEIAWSRDGATWTRSRTRPRFIELGIPRTWDDTWINLTANDPIHQGNLLWFYYSGRSSAHSVAYPHNLGHIGLATLRVDGFCSMQAQEAPGWIVTKPMTWPDADLLLNYDARRDNKSHPTNHAIGEIRIAALDAAGKEIKGFTFDDFGSRCGNTGRVNGATCYAPQMWGDNENRSLRKLKGKRMRLKFQLRDIHLYSFKAGKAS